jgi:hypothetical protein
METPFFSTDSQGPSGVVRKVPRLLLAPGWVLLEPQESRTEKGERGRFLQSRLERNTHHLLGWHPFPTQLKHLFLQEAFLSILTFTPYTLPPTTVSSHRLAMSPT